MSSSDRLSRRAALLALAVVPALMLGGCFRPMYASAPDGTSLTQGLAAVDVTPIEGRIGQQVRNALQYGLTGGSGAAPPRYRLDVKLDLSNATSIVESNSDEPLINTVILAGTFTLVDLGTNTILAAGKNYARKSYDRTQERFGAVRAARDAENAIAVLLAEQIRNRVAIALSGKP